MTNIELAIAALETELYALKLGTPAQPEEGSPEWLILRAKALGLSYLRQIRAAGLQDRPQSCEDYYRRALSFSKSGADSDPVQEETPVQ